MLKHEFEELIGYKVTDKTYNEANAIYMNAGEMTKEDFCKEWLKVGKSPLVKLLSEAVDSCRVTIGNKHSKNEILKQRENALRGRINDAACRLIGLGSSSAEAHEVAIDLIGHREVLRIMLADQRPLFPIDYEELAKYLPAKPTL